MKHLLLVSALLLGPAALAEGQAAGAREARPAGSVNWEGQVLKATGSGAPNMKASSAAQARLGAELAAKMDAFRNLIAQARGITVSSGRTLGDEMSKDEIRGRVEGVIHGYKITDKRYFSDQGVEIDVEVPLAAISAALPAPEPGQLALKTDGEPTNTGLVVDARGLPVTPALCPRLLDEAGKPLFTAGSLSEATRRERSPASYFQSLDAARGAALVGGRPLVVKAIKASGPDLVLGAEDARKLAEANNGYLAEGRVAIVTDRR